MPPVVFIPEARGPKPEARGPSSDSETEGRDRVCVDKQLAKELFHRSKGLNLTRHYRDQFDRAMLSISLNLAEGSAKESKKGRHHFYQIALGSLREVQALIDILELDHLKKDADVLGAHIFNLCRSLRAPSR